MAYNSFSEYARTGDLGTKADVVNANPASSDAETVSYPTKFDIFVNKSADDNTVAFAVTDELHEATDVIGITGGTASGYLHLYHRPMAGASITYAGDATLVPQTGNVDYNAGLVYFTTSPTGQFRVSYVSRPDSYFGDHINALQNSVMKLQDTVGAGSDTGDGFKNAEFWVDSVNGNLSSIMPNLVHTRGLTKDHTIGSVAATSNTITVGNNQDTVNMDVSIWNIYSSDGSTAVTGQIGSDSTDVLNIVGGVHLQSTGAALGTGHYNTVFAVGDPMQSIGSGQSASAGPYSLAGTTGAIARIYGDFQVIGDVHVAGAITALATAYGDQISIISESLSVGSNLYVTGNTTLGSASTTTTAINGTTVFNRWIHVKGSSKDRSRFDYSIDFTNPGNTAYLGSYADAVTPPRTAYYPDQSPHVGRKTPTAPGTDTDITTNQNTVIDGLDPSYAAKLLLYRGFDRGDFKNNTINDGPRVGIAGHISANAGSSQSSFADNTICWPTYGASLVAYNTGTYHSTLPPGHHTGWTEVGYSPVRWYNMGGDYYYGKFANDAITMNSGEFSGDYQVGDGPDWYVEWTDESTLGLTTAGARKAGARVPLNNIAFDYHSANPFTATGSLVTLSRAFNTVIETGVNYTLFHKTNSEADALQYLSSSQVRIAATESRPIIANKNGIYKVFTKTCDKAFIASHTGINFVYLELDTPEIAKASINAGRILETNVEDVVIANSLVESDSRVLIGEFRSEAPGGINGIVAGSVVSHAYNARYDSLWFRTQSTGNVQANNGDWGALTQDGFTQYYNNKAWAAQGSFRLSSGAHSFDTPSNTTGNLTVPDIGDVFLNASLTDQPYKVRIHHRFGTRKRFDDAKVKVFVAPNIPGTGDSGYVSSYHDLYGGPGDLPMGPDYIYERQLEDKYFDVVHLNRNYCDIALYNIHAEAGAIIGVREDDDQVSSYPAERALDLRNGVTFTGNYYVNARNRSWWWTRIVIE